jgi:hypothetical protein
MISPILLHNRVRRVAKAYACATAGGKLAYELSPAVVTYKGEGIHRLVEEPSIEGSYLSRLTCAPR